MARNLEPKCKQCRRVGEKLFLKGERCASAKCSMVKRNYPPGCHGPKGKQRLSDYGLQLKEKQKAKKQYNLLEKQFKLTFFKARNSSGDTGENFLRLLETRLDNVIYRWGLAPARSEARQLVNHGHFTVNGRKVDIPSCQLKTGDILKIKENSLNKKVFSNIAAKIKKEEIPGWLYFNPEDFSLKILHSPKAAEIESNLNPRMIVEFYSR